MLLSTGVRPLDPASTDHHVDRCAPQAVIAVVENDELARGQRPLWFVERDLQATVRPGQNRAGLVALAVAGLRGAT